MPFHLFKTIKSLWNVCHAFTKGNPLAKGFNIGYLCFNSIQISIIGPCYIYQAADDKYFKHRMQRIWENGLFTHWTSLFGTAETYKKCLVKNGQAGEEVIAPLKLLHLISPFMFFTLGVSLSFLAFMGEIIFSVMSHAGIRINWTI